MKKEVEHFVRTCPKCQHAKYDNKKLSSSLQPLQILNATKKDVVMDFIIVLPKTKGKLVILMIIERLLKYAHFIALSIKFSTIIIA